MICKNCALKVSVLFNYSIGNHILDAEADKENKMSCKKPAGVISEKENGVFNSELFFPLDLESRLCRCTSCLEEYKKQELEYILNEEQIKENAWNIDAMDMEISDEEDDSNENAAEPSSDLFSDTGSHLTQEQKLLVASKLQDLMAAFKQGLKEEVLASSAVNKGEMDDIRKDIVVSGEDMARVIQKVGHIMKNRSSSKRKREDVDLN